MKVPRFLIPDSLLRRVLASHGSVPSQSDPSCRHILLRPSLPVSPPRNMEKLQDGTDEEEEDVGGIEDDWDFACSDEALVDESAEREL